jgi:putative adhesin
VAGDRVDTVVTVSPTSPTKEADRRGAEETRVELDGSRLTIVTPRPRFAVVGPKESVDVRVELPSGSRLTAEIALGTARTTGRLGATRIKALGGGVHVDTTGDLWLRAGHGNADVVVAEGDAEIGADHGQIRLGRVTGDAILKASHGSVRVGKVGGTLEAKLSYGDLEVDHAVGSVVAKTAYGSIRLDEVASGSVEAESGYGEVGVGVQAGVSAWLDLASKKGRIRNELEADGHPTTPSRASRCACGRSSVTSPCAGPGETAPRVGARDVHDRDRGRPQVPGDRGSRRTTRPRAVRGGR